MITDTYIDYILCVRRYSARTAEIYAAALDCFVSFAAAGSSDEEILEALTHSSVRNWEVYLMDEKKLDPRTVGTYLSVLSGFCKFLVKDGKLQANPVRLVTRPKTPKRLPTFYRDTSMEDYFASTEHFVNEEALQFLQGFGPDAYKDKTAVSYYEARLRRLIVSLLFNTGMRRSELLSLTCASLDMGRKVIKVHGKGDKMREIPLVDSLCKEILLYLQSVETMTGLQNASDRPLLVTAKGKSLYPVYVDRAVKSELGGIGSITGRKSPHVLRHTLATELLNGGTDLNSIKELLGHSSLAATQVYTHNSIEKLKNVYETAHPRAKSGENHGD